MPSEAPFGHPSPSAVPPRSRPAGFGARPPAQIWGALDRDRRLAAVAALALFLTMLLPWYQQNAVVGGARAAPLVSRNLNAFQVFSFVEAAVLLVALAVLFLLYARAQGRDFRLPGGDGGVVLAAGLWSALLLVLRLFDKPGVTQHGVAANVGVQWGIFFALAAAGLLAYTGSRMRAAQRPEPPLVRRSPRPRAYEQPPPREPGEQDTAVIARREPNPLDPPARATPAAARPRERFPPAPKGAAARPEQLSFEDPGHDV